MSDFLLYPQHLAYCLADGGDQETEDEWANSHLEILTRAFSNPRIERKHWIYLVWLPAWFIFPPQSCYQTQLAGRDLEQNNDVNRTVLFSLYPNRLSSSWHWPNWSCWPWSYHNETVSLQFSPKLDGARREIFSKLRCGQPHESNTYQAWGRTFLDTWG